MTTFAPTAEQQAIIDAFTTGENLVIEAGAGAGKTSTLQLLAAARPGAKFLYVAYNKAIQVEASTKFPANVTCKTAHSLAFGTHGHRYAKRLNGPRVNGTQAARILGITQGQRITQDPKADTQIILAPAQIARLATDTVKRWCTSADDAIHAGHVPAVNGIDTPAERKILIRIVLPYAERVWADVVSADGRLKFEHDYYLKMWSLSRPTLRFDVILLDEAQDSNPPVASVVEAQTHAQLVLVGDRCQAIYGWRGAVDAMEHFSGRRLYLSQSFRFGPAVAAEANKWLEVLDADLRITGFDKIPSRVDYTTDRPDAILCRSNAGAIEAVLGQFEKGRRVALVGGGAAIKALALAAADLKNGRPTEHPELFAFPTWGAVQEYVEQDSAGADLKVLVTIVDKYGTDVLVAMCDRLVDENRRDAQGNLPVVVSTAHKAKGREWSTVVIADDYPEPKSKDDEPAVIPDDLAMLAYVAVTRAQRVLNPGGLAWINEYVGAGAAKVTVEAADAVVETTTDTRCVRCGGGAGCPCDPAVKAAWLATVGADPYAGVTGALAALHGAAMVG